MPDGQENAVTADKSARVLDLGIEGMTCASCVARIERAIQGVPGVRDAAVNLATGRARVTAESGTEIGSIVSAVQAAGYAPRIEVVSLAVVGMTCASCVGRVERALKAVPGVLEASVNLAARNATMRVPAGAPRSRWRSRASVCSPTPCASGASPRPSLPHAARATSFPPPPEAILEQAPKRSVRPAKGLLASTIGATDARAPASRSERLADLRRHPPERR